MASARFDRYVVTAQKFGARTVLFQHAAAARLGLTPTELETFRIIQHHGPITAADLARQTGLTPASMSAIVDKLSKRDFLVREQDDRDRRRWMLAANPNALALLEALYGAHAARVERLLTQYSEAQFDVVMEFMTVLAGELQETAIEFARDGAER